MRLIITLFAMLMLFSCSSTPTTTNNYQTNTINYTEKIHAWFQSIQTPSGLMMSSENDPTSPYTVSLYDQALSIMVFLIMDDTQRAEKILDYFSNRINSELLVAPGGFSQFRSINGVIPAYDRRCWLGDNAYFLAAVYNYVLYTGNSNRYLALQTNLENWITNLQDTDGGLIYGSTNGIVYDLKIVEGNIDAFGAVPGYTSFHSGILNYFENNRWSSSDGLLITWPSSPNPNWLYACDNISWAYCAIESFPEASFVKAVQRFQTTITSAANGQVSTGFCFDADNDTIHPEATMSMAVAYMVAGQTTSANYYTTESEKLMLPGVSNTSALGLPYSSGAGTTYGGDTLYPNNYNSPWISSSAWYLFARKNFNPFGYARNRGIPAGDKFW